MDDFEKQLAEQLKPKPKKTRAKKQSKAIKPEVVISTEIVQAGKSPGREKILTPKQREAIRKQLVSYYGTSKVDRALLGASRMPDVCERLCRLRDRMERDIKEAEENQEKYFENIEQDYSKIGRPNAPFTFQELDYLCSIACTPAEIAGFFDLHVKTLKEKVKKEYGVPWAEYYERRSQGVKIAVRRAQIHNAVSGSDSMQKFLGINLLGQKQKVEFEGQVQVNTFADLVKNLDNKINATPDNPDNDNPISSDESSDDD